MLKIINLSKFAGNAENLKEVFTYGVNLETNPLISNFLLV